MPNIGTGSNRVKIGSGMKPRFRSRRVSDGKSRISEKDVLSILGERAELSEDEVEYIHKIFNSNSPVEIHKNLNRLIQEIDVPINIVRDIVDMSYEIEKKEAPPYLGSLWHKFTPFCHGTGDYEANIIRKEGLKSRLNMNKDKIEISQWREEDWDSMLDRIYFSVSDKLGNSIGSAQKADSGIHLFFFDDKLLDLEPVMDEDALMIVKDRSAVNAYRSAEEGGTFAVRKNVPPSLIRKEFIFNPYKPNQIRKEARKVAEYLAEFYREPDLVDEFEKDLLEVFEACEIRTR